MEERILDLESNGEETDHKTKQKKTRYKITHEWNMQVLWDTEKRSNIQIIGIEEGDEMHVKGTEMI